MPIGSLEQDQRVIDINLLVSSLNLPEPLFLRSDLQQTTIRIGQLHIDRIKIGDLRTP